MQDVIAQVLGYARAAWRYRWYALIVAWPLALAGWIYVAVQPDQYEAKARVYIDTRSMLRPLLRGLAIETDVGSQVALMTRTLLSRPNLEKVARMTDLDLKAKEPQQMEQLLEGLKDTIKIEGTGRENIYSISYVHNNPAVAKRVVQSLLTILVEGTLGESRKDSSTAQQFLDEQIREYETRLIAAEERLKEFKQRNVGRMPGQGGDYYSRLQEALAAAEDARVQLREAVNRRDELRRQLEDEEPGTELATLTIAPQSPAVAALQSRINSLEARLDELLLKYTDSHPDVISTKQTIADLEKQKQQELQNVKKQKPVTQQRDTNPVYSQLKLMLGEAEAQVASLQARSRAYDGKVAELRSMVNVIPEVETELVQLNRDYEVTKNNYETLLARRESATLSEQAEQTSDTIKFRVVDPPHVPLRPAAPNRPLLNSGVLAAAIAGGAVFAFFLSQLAPTFGSRRELVEATELPVLGGVSMVWTPQQKRRMRLELAGFATVGAMLLAAYSVIITIELTHTDAVRKIKNLVGGFL